MNTLKLFIWFTRESWHYKQGDRAGFFRHFWGAWCVFYGLEMEDREH